MPASPRVSRIRLALNAAETIAIILIALNLTPQLWRRYFPNDRPDAVRWQEYYRLRQPQGDVWVKAHARGPSTLEVHAEAFVTVDVDFEGLPLKQAVEVTFTPAALGLNVQPQTPVKVTATANGMPN